MGLTWLGLMRGFGFLVVVDVLDCLAPCWVIPCFLVKASSFQAVEQVEEKWNTGCFKRLVSH